MANRIIRAGYVSAKGVTFAVGINEEVFVQESGDPLARIIGGASLAAGSAHYPLPLQMKPRRAVCFNPAGTVREVILLTATAPLATPGATITLEDSDGAATTFTCDRVKGEEYRARRQQPL